MRILVIAAHPDDEVLGVGGSIAHWSAQGREVHILIVTEGCSAQYPGQPELIARKEAEATEAARLLGAAQVHFGRLPDMKLDTLPGTQINHCIESVVRHLQPEVVYTQAEHDINADHGLVFRATCVACRPYAAPYVRELLTYYTPSSSEWGSPQFAPNVYLDISSTIERKLDAMHAYHTELRSPPHPRSPESLKAIAAAHGSVVGFQYAEVFHLVRRADRRLLS